MRHWIENMDISTAKSTAPRPPSAMPAERPIRVYGPIGETQPSIAPRQDGLFSNHTAVSCHPDVDVATDSFGLREALGSCTVQKLRHAARTYS